MFACSLPPSFFFLTSDLSVCLSYHSRILYFLPTRPHRIKLTMLQYSVLTPSMRERFLTHGYVKIPSAIPSENVTRFTQLMWTRLNWDREDKNSWVDETVHMPRHREVATKEFMPLAHAAACESRLSIFQEHELMWRWCR